MSSWYWTAFDHLYQYYGFTQTQLFIYLKRIRQNKAKKVQCSTPHSHNRAIRSPQSWAQLALDFGFHSIIIPFVYTFITNKLMRFKSYVKYLFGSFFKFGMFSIFARFTTTFFTIYALIHFFCTSFGIFAFKIDLFRLEVSSLPSSISPSSFWIAFSCSFK